MLCGLWSQFITTLSYITYNTLFCNITFYHFFSGTGQADSDRHRFVDTLLNLVGHINHEGKKLKIVHDEDKQVNDGVVHFHQEDNMAISFPTNFSSFRYANLWDMYVEMIIIF